MAQFKIAVKLMKAFIKSSAELNNDVIVQIKKTKMEICQMDKSHIALVHAQLESNEFIEYNYEKDELFCFEYNKQLKTYLKNLKSDNCIIEINFAQKTYSIIAIQNNIETRFNDILQNYEVDDINVENMDYMLYDNKYNISVELLNQIVNCKSEIIQIKQSENSLQLSADEQVFTINNKSNFDVNVYFAQYFMSKLLIAHSELFNKQSKLFKNATIELNYKSETSLKAVIKFDELHFVITYYIAPRVDEESESEQEEKVEQKSVKKSDSILFWSKESIKAYINSEIERVKQERSQISTQFKQSESKINSFEYNSNYLTFDLKEYYSHEDKVLLNDVLTRLTEKLQSEKANLAQKENSLWNDLKLLEIDQTQIELNY